MARITRRELKSDKFALEVEHTVTLFDEHKQQILRYGGIAVVVILLVVGFMIYRGQQHVKRQAALTRAILVEQTPVGAPPPGATNVSAFPTQQVKDETAIKVFTDLKKQYPSSDEGEIGQYFLGTILANQGKLADAEKNLQQASGTGDAKYASLAKLALAEVYFSQGKIEPAKQVLNDLAAHPTIFVSKEQALLAEARALIPLQPAEARKILDTLRTTPGAVSQVALTLYGQLPPQ